MPSASVDALAVGHVCLDIMPRFLGEATSLSQLLVPGKLVDVGEAVLSTGGSASNVGLALHRLGFAVDIVGKVGGDAFGETVINMIREQGEHLARNMIVAPGESTSYTIVINPPGIDRIFLHSSAANDTFTSRDVGDEVFGRARLLHFGYPPLMRGFYRDDGAELAALFRRGKEAGLATSLDMARPDPDGPSGRVDWVRILANVLPHVDMFLPSIDEIAFMLSRGLFDALVRAAEDGNPASRLRLVDVRGLADRLLGMGTAMVGFKLGDQGFYLKTTGDARRLAAMGRLAPSDVDAWVGVELIGPCRQVEVVGTTGAGDCTIAGFLGAMLRGLDPDAAVAMAVGVGAASVETKEATSGVVSWEAIEGRIAAGWPQKRCVLIPPEWSSTPAGNFRAAPARA